MELMEFPGGSQLRAEVIELGANVQIGSDVQIDARHICLGDGVKIGVAGDDGFRYPGGVRVAVEDLQMGSCAQIDRHVMVSGGAIRLNRDTAVRPNTTIKVKKRLVIGAHGIINSDCEIAGVDIEIGRELWMLPNAKIGGGSAFEVHSRLRAGHWCHIGVRTFLNTARPIEIGDEVGLGTGTCLYTHGAYASALDGKPVAFGPIAIGDRTWLPGAIVNPGVKIGKDCVIGVGALVSRDIPDGSLAGGVPAKVIRENAYPKPLTGSDRVAFLQDFMKTFSEICSDSGKVTWRVSDRECSFTVNEALVAYLPELTESLSDWDRYSDVVVLTDRSEIPTEKIPRQATIVDCENKTLQGHASSLTERLLNQLRRYGIRFYFENVDGRYAPWKLSAEHQTVR